MEPLEHSLLGMHERMTRKVLLVYPYIAGTLRPVLEVGSRGRVHSCEAVTGDQPTALLCRHSLSIPANTPIKPQLTP
jgi:hypothetical protein